MVEAVSTGAAWAAQVSSLPAPGDFRDWMRDAIVAVGTTPAGLARRAGLSQNAVARILKAEGDVYLGSAVALERALLALAGEQDVALAPLGAGGEV